MDVRITDVTVARLRTIEHVGDLEPAWDVGGAMRFTRGGGSVTQVHTDAGITGIGPGMDPRCPRCAICSSAPTRSTWSSMRAAAYHVRGVPYQGRRRRGHCSVGRHRQGERAAALQAVGRRA
ncbi:MAG: hypothetical protein H6644_21740 [Caldilineaceae bacterium]|nr:hypothetical protein [Caldilineaceae bacterium]